MKSRYDPFKHHRHSIRLQGYDYSQAGAYFATACTKNRECILGMVRNDEVELSALGEIVGCCWENLPRQFPNVRLDAFVVMPNHIHGIILLTENVGATLAVAPDKAGASPAPTGAMRPKLGDVVGTFRSLCVNNWLDYINQNHLNAIGKFWQRNYYEHIVRDERDLNRIREYIATNPIRWDLDRENPNRLDRADDWQTDEERWFGKIKTAH